MATKSTCLLTTSKSLQFKVTRQPPELITPAAPTPYEFKELSNIDDQQGLRFLLPVILFYPGGSGPAGSDPVRVIKEALGKALVSYYPLAGRLRQKQGKKLVVECNGDGILFIEADAHDTTINDFEDGACVFPVSCFDQLLYDVSHSAEILHSPLLLIQVTRLKCRGFILVMRLNHALLDAPGMVQFLNTTAELARGIQSPSVYPVWERHIFRARDPPRVNCLLRAYEEVVDTKPTITPLDDMVKKSFFFGPNEISALRRFVPPHLNSSTTFEVLSACLWWCRTIAIQPDPEEIVRFMFVYNIRSKFKKLVPKGYYGNAFVFPMAIASAYKLSHNPIDYALELVKKAKANITEEFIMSTVDLMEIKGRPFFNVINNFTVSDITQDGFNIDHLDFGWGLPKFAGPTLDGVVEDISSLLSFYIPFKNSKGEQGTTVPMCLPSLAMERFVKELENMLSDFSDHPMVSIEPYRVINSTL